jgi:nucleotide-binding universal stress UspA family protein
MYTRILVPVDGSATAEAVLPYVEAFAQGFRSTVELISAIDIRAIAPSLAADKTHHPAALIAAEEKQSRTYLEHVAEKFGHFPTECRTVRGDPAEVILEAASKDRKTMIAMATHGRSGVKRWLLGSVAEKVLRGTTHALFMVRAAAAQTSPERIINSIIVPLDGSPLAELILPVVSSWARALDVEVTLVRAIEFSTATSLANTGLLRPDYDALREAARKEATDYLKAKENILVAEGVRTISTITLEGPAADEIISYAQTSPRAVIAMSTHGRSGLRRWILGSVTEKVVRHANDPVLVVRGQ